jgi:predicted permease
MDIFLTTFTAVATLLFIGVLGFWVIARRIIAGNVLGALSVLAIDIALPCLTFTGIMASFNPDKDSTGWTMPLWWAGFMASAFLLTVVSSLISKREYRREFMASVLFQNAIFFPLAILAQMFGSGTPILVSLFLFTLIHPALFFNGAPLFFNRNAKMDLGKFFNPVLVATILAVLLRILNLQGAVPGFILSALGIVGAMTVPLLMLVLGGNIYLDMKGTKRFEYLESAKFVLVKNIVFPAVALLILMLVRPPFEISLIIMLQSAVPRSPRYP